MFKKLFFIFSIVFFGTISAQKTQNVDLIPYPNMRIQNNVQSQPSLFKRTVFTKELSTVGGKASEPLFIINEKIASSAEFRKLDPNNIKSVTVLKDNAAKSLYGEGGKNGAIIITTKENILEVQ